MAEENTNDAMVDEPVGGDEEVGVEQAAEAPTTTAEGSKTMEVAGVTLNEAQLPLFIVLIASIVLLIATGAEYDWNITVCVLHLFCILFCCCFVLKSVDLVHMYLLFTYRLRTRAAMHRMPSPSHPLP